MPREHWVVGDRVDTTINHISLCTGYGGIDLGLRAVLPTCRTITCVEIEAFACANLVAKMEAGELDPAPIWTDLHTFDARPYRGHVGILSGGFPCQPFSQSGHRRADADPRHLFPEIERIIDECRPGCIFLENVEGIISSRLRGAAETSVLKHVLERLEKRGYAATWGIFSAEECGAPHRRNRVFILCLAHAYRARGRQDREPAKLRAESSLEPSSNSGRTNTSTIQQVTQWPVRPGQIARHWEEPRTIEPGMGRATDGTSTRLDRLRLLGNGVVPQTAAVAFSTLLTELIERKTQ